MTTSVNPSYMRWSAEHNIVLLSSAVEYCMAVFLLVNHLVHMSMDGNHRTGKWFFEFILLPFPLLLSGTACRLLAPVISDEALRDRLLRIVATLSMFTYMLVIILLEA